MKSIEFHPDAALEAREAAAFYEKAREGLGSDFREELAIVLKRIQENPQFYAAEDGSIRIGPLHRFPYAVYYEESDAHIWIAAVGHLSRRPGYWSSRLPE